MDIQIFQTALVVFVLAQIAVHILGEPKWYIKLIVLIFWVGSLVTVIGSLIALIWQQLNNYF